MDSGVSPMSGAAPGQVRPHRSRRGRPGGSSRTRSRPSAARPSSRAARSTSRPARRRSRLLSYRLRNHRGRLDLEARLGLDQARPLHDCHGREMPAHQLAIRCSDIAQRGEIFLLVEHIPGEPHDVMRLAARLGQDLEDVGDRLAELAGEVARSPFALRRPANLAGDEDQAAFRHDAVGVALGARPAGRLQDLHHACFLNLKRCSLPVSVRGSVSTNVMARGYLYGAIAFFTWSCSVLTIASPAVWPSFSTTNALTMVPRSSSGQPMTPHSATASCASSAVSISGPAML